MSGWMWVVLVLGLVWAGASLFLVAMWVDVWNKKERMQEAQIAFYRGAMADSEKVREQVEEAMKPTRAVGFEGPS